ncbi:hypothetical protein G3496_17775 [Shewanella baltica]|uniref:hypothetical protein n=1 Tax=Shewanella baltica TaxID=62322 RepID=UPI00217CEA72|nr:hypothetical protein [Shewanella baltica]MCS6136769.1 hypothetical protein [Shewanella baltica]
MNGSQLFKVPTVPIAVEYLENLITKQLPENLEEDKRFLGKIKWYSTPVVFGGDPSEQNMIWVNHLQHRELVIYWNEQYRMAKA